MVVPDYVLRPINVSPVNPKARLDPIVAIRKPVNDWAIPCLVCPLGQVLDEVFRGCTVMAGVLCDDHC